MALFGCNRFSPYGIPSRYWNHGSFMDDTDPWEQHWAPDRPGPLRVFFLGNVPEENPCPKRIERRRERKTQPWSETFHIGDRFNPKNVTIKTTDNTVTVTAKRKQLHHDCLGEGHSIEQMTRTVYLPKDVNTQSVKAFISTDGDLKLIGQRNKAITCGRESCKDSAGKSRAVKCKTLQSLAAEALSDSDSYGENNTSLKGTETNREHTETARNRTEDEISENIEDMQTLTFEAENNTEVVAETDTKSTVVMSDDENAKVVTEAEVKNTTEEEEEITDIEITEEEEKEPWSTQLNLEGFQPEDVTVNVKGNFVTVTAEHKEEKDGMYSSKHIKRAFTLPKNVSPDEISSHMSESGTLRLTAPVVQAVEYTPNERQLTVQPGNLPTIEK